MKKANVDECVKECKKFLKRAKEFSKIFEEKIFVTESLRGYKAVSALKRQSMALILARALLRKSY